MRRFSFILTILGILLLIIILNQKPIEINSEEDLEKIPENKKIKIIDKVVSEKIQGNLRILTLENNIKLICDCKNYLNKKIYIEGIKDNYLNKNQIIVLKIKEVN